MMKYFPTYRLWCFCLLILLCACQSSQPGTDTLFVLLDARQTGIDFQNTITPDGDLNLLNFEYMYNGGGVGVGDFDKNGLPDLVFTGNMTDSKLYLNQGQLSFKDITKTAGFNTNGKWCTGVAVADVNADGWDDIYVSVGGPENKSIYPNLLFINQGNATFREVATEFGLNDPNQSNQAVFFDYDRDGDLDMYLLNGGGFEKSAITVRPILKNGAGRNTDKLYRNDFDAERGHPVFTDVSKEAGVLQEGFGLGVGVVDANADGWPDVYISNDYLSPDLLYINQQDGTFSEEASQFFDHMSHFSMGNDIGDINNDGQMDIVTLDMLPESHFRRKMMFGPNQHDRFHMAARYGYGHQHMRNMLHLGDGQTRFREIGRMAGIDQTDWSWCPLLADYDNDGWQDIYITNGYGKDITDLDFVNFRKNAVSQFAEPEKRRQKLIASLKDLPSITLPNYIYQNKGQQKFEKKTTAWGFDQPSISNGAAYADLDKDGDLELIVNNINQKAFVYKNKSREQDSLTANYLQVQLTGPSGNAAGIGTRLELYAGAHFQTRYHQTVRGFQSSVSGLIHFGLGTYTQVDSLIVRWPDGKQQRLFSLSANTTLQLNYSDAQEASGFPTQIATLLQKQDLQHNEQPAPIVADDFKMQSLLLHGFTEQGPGIAVGDVNQDKLEDIFVGGAYGQPARIMIQQNNGRFKKQQISTEAYEDLGALFIDIDQDGDLDLYVASGGSERYAGHENYQDRIYVNNGQGQFSLQENALPQMRSSTATVAASDFDQDGDLDLFVGGRVVPGKYPLSPQSYLLENNNGIFKDVTAQLCPPLKNIGMVTAAIWTDFDNDHQQDLIVVGEMMAIQIFRKEKDGLHAISAKVGLDQLTGMWNSISSGDFDNDGDTDYLLGNLGKNHSYEISAAYPLQLHYADFDDNGAIDPIFSMYEEGAYHPIPSLNLLSQQLPKIKKKVLRYENYARSTTQDILELLGASEVDRLTCAFDATAILENKGQDQFELHALPLEAQVAPVKGTIVEDFNSDGLPDVLLVGNEYNTEVVNGKYDASRGAILINKGNWDFEFLTPSESGLYSTGDTRAAVKFQAASGQLSLLISNANGELERYQLNGKIAFPTLAFQPNEVSAKMELNGGQVQKMEHQIGSGYLSQQSAVIRLPANAQQVHFYDAFGRKTRTINLTDYNINI